MRTLDSLQSGGYQGIDRRHFGRRQQFELRWMNRSLELAAFVFGSLAGGFAGAPFLNFPDAFAEFFPPFRDGAPGNTRKLDQGGFSFPGLSWSIAGWFHFRVVRRTRAESAYGKRDASYQE
jgi:hypothetical protein